MPDDLRREERALNEGPVGYRAAGKSGGDSDISPLEDSLRLTPWQRLIENDRALALVRMLEQARVRENGTA